MNTWDLIPIQVYWIVAPLLIAGSIAGLLYWANKINAINLKNPFKRKKTYGERYGHGMKK